MFFKRLAAAWFAFRDYEPPRPVSLTTSVSVSTPLGTYLTPRHHDPRPALRAALKLCEMCSMKTIAENENNAQALLKLIGNNIKVRESADLVPGVDFKVVSHGGYIDDRIIETAKLYIAAIDEVAKNNPMWPEFRPPSHGFGTRC